MSTQLEVHSTSVLLAEFSSKLYEVSDFIDFEFLQNSSGHCVMNKHLTYIIWMNNVTKSYL